MNFNVNTQTVQMNPVHLNRDSQNFGHQETCGAYLLVDSFILSEGLTVWCLGSELRTLFL